MKNKSFYLRILLLLVFTLALASCAAPFSPEDAPEEEAAPEETAQPEEPTIEFNYSPVASDGHYANNAEFTNGDWHRIRETINRSEIRDGEFVSIPLTGNEHGDWPAWFAEHQIDTDRPTKDGEIYWDISTKMIIDPESEDLWVHYRFRLDQQMLDELDGEPYSAAASGGNNTLGLFLGSQKGVDLLVNGEKYYIRGNFCHDCTAGTRLDDLDDYEYRADDLTHFGFAGHGTTDELLIIPIEEDFEGVIDIIMKIKAGTEVILWFGVANH